MSEDEPPAAPRRARRAIERPCEWLALVGGAVLVGIALMSAVSIVGRWLFSIPVQGDYELVQMGCAAFVACSLPIAQLRYANIIVDFFTTGAKPRTQGLLDATGALMVALVMAAVAWRTGAGMVDMFRSNQTTTILGVPTWYTYAAMMPGLALCAVAAMWCAWEKLVGAIR
jgi:TRAP-type C4-dicarboxylate transport system permease small subunit